MSRRPATHAALPLIEALLDGTIDDAGFAQLEEVLRVDAEARAIYRSLANIHAAIPGIVNQAPRLTLQVTDTDGDTLVEPHEMSREQFLSLMMQVESEGQDLDPMVLAAKRFPAPPNDSPTREDWLNAGRYILDKAKGYRQQAIMGAAAAVMLLATVLFLTWGGADQPPLVSNDTAKERPDRSNRTPLIHVATLTAAAHDARWQSDIDFGTPEPGKALLSGQRLVLTQGFAEITTNRGAVVILEAPCEIELIDSPNAIRLHAGKLVGTCETASSKGFMVRTPHMDITDLGTRFGVVTDGQASSLRVLEGDVEVLPSVATANIKPVQLIAGQAAVVDKNADRVVLDDQVTDRFVHDLNAVVNVPELTGPIRYEPSIPSDLRVGASKDKDVRLFHERSGVVLDTAVRVNVLEPGRYIGEVFFKHQTLSNVTADSYLVHFDNDSPADEVAHRTVTIRFDRPILGVITASEQLVHSHDKLGLPGVRYGNQSDWAAVDAFITRDSSGLDVSKTQASIGQDDAIQLSDDRQTLTLDLFTVTAIDQVRVLVQSKIQDQ